MNSDTEKVNPSAENQGVLATWKEIAAYFGCDVRTAKRWERRRGLPVHRAPGNKGGTVFAYISELEHWLQARDAPEGRKSPLSGQASEHRKGLAPAGIIAAAPIGGALQGPVREQQLSNGGWWLTSGMVIAVTLVITGVALRVVGVRSAARTESATVAAATAPLAHVPPLEAQQLYDRGRYFWNLRTHDSLTRAIDAYTQAVLKDPSYAGAYAGLAESYDLLPQFANANLGESLARAENAADRAIALDPNLAAAHRAKGFALFYWDWDIAGSDAEFKRALALDPNSAQTHQWYASTLQWRDDGLEAIRQIDEAVRLDPTSPSIAADAALLHANFGDLSAGKRALREIEETQPTLASPAQFLSELDFDSGDFPAYVDDLRRTASITRSPDDAALAEMVQRGWARAGRIGLLEARAEGLKAAFDHGGGSPFALGETLLLLGRPQEALIYFRAALDRHNIQLVAIDDFPWARKLSGNPGYAALFAQARQRVRDIAPNRPEQDQVAFELPQ